VKWDKREYNSMEKISREKLDLALDSLRKQKIEDGETGHYYAEAFCYTGPRPPVCRWDRIPGEHICAKCGKTFGDPEKTDWWLRDTADEDKGGTRVREWDVEEVLKAYRSCRKAGYDAELDMHCSECVKKHHLEKAVFKFRAPGENEYIVSFPVFRSESYSVRKKPSGKHFHSWQYALVAKFLIRSMKKTDQKDMWRRWMDHLAESFFDFGSKPWEFTEESIKGILGLSFEKLTDDASDRIDEKER
jgi:hypothetical protein